MTDNLANNKRIAKNTLVLYIRMLFMMAVSLYTSRVTLDVLGASDYGIYNVVGGVVGILSFLNGAMSSATQRYLTFSLGLGDEEKLKKVFSSALQIHVVIGLSIVLLGEIVGLWFLYNKLVIPEGRMEAAFWVLQFSVISMFFQILKVPYNAIIIAHEKMSAFAYISIVEAVLKLLIVFTLVISGFDKLILYGSLLMFVSVGIVLVYLFYCRLHFPESRYKHVVDISLLKEMSSFAGWSLFGNLSGVLFNQGISILLNIFFGPVVNAARAVAMQVMGAIQQFVNNFQMALNPQITKTYAQNDLQAMHSLMFRSSRFSFYLLFLITLPVLFEANMILNLWLVDVPDNTIVFLRLTICTSLIYCIANPMIVANMATGKVRNYQMICGSILLCILPISYLCLTLGMPAYTVYIIHFFVEVITQIARMILLRPLINLKISDYIKNVYSPIFCVVFSSVVLPCFICYYMDDNWVRFFIMGITCVMSCLFFSFLWGTTKNERTFIVEKIVSSFKRI